jgi:multidrug resistance efflux pump
MKNIRAILVTTTLLLTGCSTASKDEPKQAVISGVRIEKVATDQIDESYEATGTVRSRTATVISSQVMGVITSLKVREGDRVKAGQVLIEIDDRDAATQIEKAQAGLRQAESAVAEVDQSINAAQSAKAATEANKRLASSTLSRYQVLLDRKSVSPQEFDEVRARYQVAEAEVDRAQKMLEMLAAKKKQAQAQVEQANADVSAARVRAGHSRVVSPLTGIVSAKHIEGGAMATPGAPLLTIEDDSSYRLEASVEESQVGKVQLNDAVGIRIGSISGEELPGKVVEILPAADPASRTYLVKIAIPQKPLVRTGLYGTAHFSRGSRRAITVANGSIVRRGQLTGVFVVDDTSTARLRLITLGRNLGDRNEVLSGLSEGERIVTGGVEKVTDGSRLQ